MGDPGTRRGLIAIVAIVIVSAPIAFMIGRSLPGDEPPPAVDVSSRVAQGNLALSGWIGWERGRAPQEVTALVSEARVVNPAVTDVSVVLGDLPADRIPAMFSTLGLRASSGEELSAGALKARAYTGELPGTDPLAIMALLIPTTNGISTAVCLSRGGSTAAAEDCRTVLTTTVALRGTKPAAASPDVADASALRASISELNTRRNRDAAALSAAATSGRQANAAEALSADYSQVASRLSDFEFTQLATPSGRSLVQQLKAAAAAYDALARAADSDSRSGYTAALGTATDADAKIEEALEQLTALGYGKTEK